jgi:hypothetical protein
LNITALLISELGIERFPVVGEDADGGARGRGAVRVP